MKVITCTIHWSLMHDDTSAYSSIQMYVSACRHKQYGNIIIMPIKFISTHKHLLLHAVVETCRCFNLHLKNRMKVITCTIHWSLMHDDTSVYSSIQMYVSACRHKQYANIIIMPVKFISTHRHLLLHAMVETCWCFK